MTYVVVDRGRFCLGLHIGVIAILRCFSSVFCILQPYTKSVCPSGSEVETKLIGGRIADSL